MPKFYVTTGDFKCIVDKKTAKEAAVAAFETLDESPSSQLGLITMVSEHGYDSEDMDNRYFCTINLLEQADQLGYYKTQDWFE
jgi:hypothetical protein